MRNQHIYSDKYNLFNFNGKVRSRHLKYSDVDTIVNRARYLINNGFGYNKHITINIEQCGILNPQWFVSEFTNKMQKWHKRQNIPFVYLWVLENVASVGIHVHILIYTDTHKFRRLNEMITRWLPFKRDDSAGNKYANIKIDPVYDLEGIISYLCKGLDAMVDHQYVHIKRGRGCQGRIYGRRWAMSRYGM